MFEKVWRPYDILSKWKNDFILYFIDDTHQVKFLELNNFITENDHWGEEAEYMVYFGVR